MTTIRATPKSSKLFNRSQIISNDGKQDDENPSHEAWLVNALRESCEFDCLVAYASFKGFARVCEQLKKRLTDHDKESFDGARFYIGLDFCRTEPALLRLLYSLATYQKYGRKVEVFVSSKNPPERYYHPKIYLFKQRNGTAQAIVGSANLTQGGLVNNYEISVLVETNHDVLSDGILTFIKSLTEVDVDEDDDECDQNRTPYMVPLTKELIDEYAQKYAIFQAHLRLAERKIKRNSADMKKAATKIDWTPHLELLKDILNEMKWDQTDSGFEKAVKRRADSHAEAVKQLGLLRNEPKITTGRKFAKLYTPLTAGIWHSGGLARGAGEIAKQANGFQSALKQFDTYFHQNKGQTIQQIFQKLFELLEPIRRAGTNVLTEILHTYDEKRFAVMNQNSVAGIVLAGNTHFPTKPSKANLTADRYSDFCAAAEKVRMALKLKDLSQLDALFNYAYWSHEEDDS